MMTVSIARYLVAGGLAFAVDFGFLALLREGLGWPTGVAAAVAFLLSFAFTYSVQRRIGFASRAPHGRALVRYTILVAVNTVVTAAVVALIDQTSAGWGIGKVVATMVTTVSNFFAYRWWVFAADAHGADGTRLRQRGSDGF
ncbi:GtrA family protein [Xylanimonas protaetiae]|uniref:GtrA family protein n=1 Tax=Xylanimonas protaetiae TaxID=2509457 RepID=A0A4P6F133_9MICO|nr:GtrA family protein [Xylanimonas protaetiae]QAY68916.1 GtrA family protein [Xylanimonas protaetiae]